MVNINDEKLKRFENEVHDAFMSQRESDMLSARFEK
jgi:hypothetical protein